MRRIEKVLFWEFVQNLPLIAGFTGAFYLWQQGVFIQAVCVAVLGSSLGAVIIAATEGQIVAGHHEPRRVLWTNIGVLSLLLTGTVWYFSAAWSNRWSDLAASLSVAFMLSGAQAYAAKEPLSVRHCTAFAVSFLVAFWSMRFLLAAVPPIWFTLLLTTLVTVIIALFDYLL